MKKLQNLRNKLINGRKENKGFTLVELIVVIVILAILIGVTIGGVFGYVNKSRTNTDISNASAITSTLSVLSTNKDVCNELKGKTVTATWSEKKTVADATWAGHTTLVKTQEEVGKLLTDGFPAPKANGKFVLTITVDADGNMTVVKCIAYDGTNDTAQPLNPQE